MDSFYFGISVTAVLILIIVLTTLGIMARKINTKVVFPPISDKCPDYWPVSADGSCVIPYGSDKSNINVGAYDPATDKYRYMPSGLTLGTDADANKTIDFSSSKWNITRFGAPNPSVIVDPSCVFTAWSTGNGIQWDGISNLNTCQGSAINGGAPSLIKVTTAPATMVPTMASTIAPV